MSDTSTGQAATRPASKTLYTADYVGSGTYPHMSRTFTELSKTVRTEGLLSRTPLFYLLCGAGAFLGLLACGLAFTFLQDSWFQLIVAGALGVLFTQVAFLSHEAAHRQVLSGGRANDRLARVLAGAVVGMSYAWWDSKHSRHHANPNKVTKDPDIAIDTISFVPEDAARARGAHRILTRYQGWAFFPLLTLEGVNLHWQSLRHLLTRRQVKGRWTELSLVLTRFVLLLIPVFTVLPLGKALAFLSVQLAVFGLYMGASFAPNHKGMPVISPAARLDFFSKQVRTSRNICGGWWATALMGGLNYQIEHHLFPSMPRPHLRKARRLVREVCAQNNVPYTETSLVNSYLIVIRYLNRVGLAARDPFDCPVARQYRPA